MYANVIESKTLNRKLRKLIKEKGRSFRVKEIEDLRNPSVEDIMYVVASQKGFFAELKLLDNGLWAMLKDYPNLEFLSAPIGEFATEDKTWWVRNVLKSNKPISVMPRKEKHRKCIEYFHQMTLIPGQELGPIIIDDHPKTIIEWLNSGGRGILFPLKSKVQQSFLIEYLEESIKEESHTIYLDLDGCVADFFDSAKNKINQLIEDWTSQQPRINSTSFMTGAGYTT